MASFPLSGTAALEEDAQILKVIEAYCTSAKTRQTLNSSKKSQSFSHCTVHLHAQNKRGYTLSERGILSFLTVSPSCLLFSTPPLFWFNLSLFFFSLLLSTFISASSIYPPSTSISPAFDYDLSFVARRPLPPPHPAPWFFFRSLTISSLCDTAASPRRARSAQPGRALT